MRTTILAIICFFCIPALGFSATLTVPGMYPTIQDAIDAASNGDTVLVAPGTYSENIDFIGKAITVTSSGGPMVTVITANTTGSVVTFTSGETLSAVLEGFGITNGSGTVYPVYGPCGGGIFCKDSSPTIRNNAIYGNTVSGSGGGIAILVDASPEVTDNDIYENAALGAPYSGNGGGGIGVAFDCSPLIKGNRVHHNTANNGGGGIALGDDTSNVKSNRIHDNKAFVGGGIGTANSSKASISNNMIHDNLAIMWGGGVGFWNNSTPSMINNTLVNNTANTSGGGIHCIDSGTHVTAVNTILWNNSALLGAEISLEDASTLDISYSDVEGGQSSALVAGGATLNWGSGMIDADPLFADTTYHICCTSPCCEAGDNGCAGLPAEDFEGDPRVCSGTVDMGADEFHRHLYYTGNATPGGSVEMKFVGQPGTTQVALVIGFDVFDPALPGAYGDWYMKAPMLILTGLGPIALDGFYVLNGTLPASPAGPYTVYFQAMIDYALSNLCVMDVQ